MKTKIFKKNTILLLFGYLVSSLGDSIYIVSLIFYVLERFNDPIILGTVVTAAALPQLVFGFFAGQIVDRLDMKRMVVVADFSRALIMIVLYLLLSRNAVTPQILYLITFVISTIGVFFNPAIAAIIPQISSTSELSKINSALYATINISSVLGPVIGGFMHVIFGFTIIALINSISYFFSAITEIGIRFKPINNKINSKLQIRKELLSGIKVILNTSIIRTIILLSLITNIFFIPFFELLLPHLIESELNINADFYGSILSARAIGTIIGSIIVYKIPEFKNLIRIFLSSTILQGLLIIIVGYVSFVKLPFLHISIVFYFALFIMGIISAILNIPLNVAIQKNAPPDKIATVFSTMSSLFRVLAPLTLFVFGFLITKIGSTKLILFNGLMVIFISLIVHIIINLIKLNKKKEMNRDNGLHDQ